MASASKFFAPEAAALAGITYRQLDYWARRAWVAPAEIAEDDGRRLYGVAEIIRLAALGHVGRSGLDVAHYAEVTGHLGVPERPGFVIVWEINAKNAAVTRIRDLRRLGRAPGRYVVFDPSSLFAELRQLQFEHRRPRRRRFTSAYKLEVLREYEACTGPGAKTALLRREGLHTSHVVAWRRARDARSTPSWGGCAGGAPRKAPR